MQSRVIEILDDQLQRQVEKANQRLSELDSKEYEEWLRNPITFSFICLLEADILANTLAWQQGTLYRASVAEENPDLEAEARARHTIEAIEHVMGYLEEFEKFEKEIKRLEGKDESDRAQSPSEETSDS